MLSPGTRFGSYEVTGSLGVGGMGEACRARDTQLGREIGRMVLPASVADDPDRIARFEREARTHVPGKHTRGLGPLALAFTAVVCWSGAANAQGIANSLQELRLLVRAGDTVRVTDSTGRIRTAKIGELTPQSLVLGEGTNRVSLDEADIATVTQRRPDSLGNGALWGMGIGAGFVGVLLAAVGDGGEGAGVVAGATIAYAAIGAGLGVGVDALIRRHAVVFERTGGAGARVHVSPLVSPRAAGARIALTF